MIKNQFFSIILSNYLNCKSIKTSMGRFNTPNLIKYSS